MTMVSDKGLETIQMIKFQKLLRYPSLLVRALLPNSSALFRLGRRDAAPEIPEDEFRLWVQVQSKHNTPIEGFWLWLCEGKGHNIRNMILEGATDYDADDPLHG